MLKAAVSVIALGCVIGLEFYALQHGVDGIALSASIGAVGAIGGYWARKARE